MRKFIFCLILSAMVLVTSAYSFDAQTYVYNSKHLYYEYQLVPRVCNVKVVTTYKWNSIPSQWVYPNYPYQTIPYYNGSYGYDYHKTYQVCGRSLVLDILRIPARIIDGVFYPLY